MTWGPESTYSYIIHPLEPDSFYGPKTSGLERVYCNSKWV